MRMKLRAILFGFLLGLGLVSSAAAQQVTQCVTNAAGGGTGDAITVPLLPCGLATNLLILTIPGTNATTTPTLQMTGFSALPIVNLNGTALAVGQLGAGANSVALLSGTGTSWLLVSPSTTATGNVTGPASSVDQNCAKFSGTTGKLLADAGAACGTVTGPGSSTNLDCVQFNGTTGKVIADAGVACGAGAVTKIACTTTAGSAANVTFSSIPGTYTSLEVLYNGRGDTAANDTGVNLQVNADTGTNYDYQAAFFNNAISTTYESGSAQTNIDLPHIPAASSTAGWAGTGTVFITNYAGTTFMKQLSANGGYESAGNGNRTMISWGMWKSTSAITSLKFFPGAGNFVNGSSFCLYGIQ